MSPRPRFLKLAREKQRSILEAAAEEFAARGFDGASFNKIIQRAGISKGAAYYYFEDKEDLYATVFQRTLDHLLETTGDEEFWDRFERSEPTEEEFWNAISEHGRRQILQLKPHPYLVAFFRHLFAYTEAHASSKTVSAMMTYSRERTDRFLARGIELGILRADVPRDLLIEITFSLGLTLDRWLFDRIEDMDEAELSHTVDQIVSLYRGMLSPQNEQKEKS